MHLKKPFSLSASKIYVHFIFIVVIDPIQIPETEKIGLLQPGHRKNEARIVPLHPIKDPQIKIEEDRSFPKYMKMKINR